MQTFDPSGNRSIARRHGTSTARFEQAVIVIRQLRMCVADFTRRDCLLRRLEHRACNMALGKLTPSRLLTRLIKSPSEKAKPTRANNQGGWTMKCSRIYVKITLIDDRSKPEEATLRACFLCPFAQILLIRREWTHEFSSLDRWANVTKCPPLRSF